MIAASSLPTEKAFEYITQIMLIGAPAAVTNAESAMRSKFASLFIAAESSVKELETKAKAPATLNKLTAVVFSYFATGSEMVGDSVSRLNNMLHIEVDEKKAPYDTRRFAEAFQEACRQNEGESTGEKQIASIDTVTVTHALWETMLTQLNYWLTAPEIAFLLSIIRDENRDLASFLQEGINSHGFFDFTSGAYRQANHLRLIDVVYMACPYFRDVAALKQRLVSTSVPVSV
jgi:hypothetical protein